MHIAMEYMPFSDLESNLQELEKFKQNIRPHSCLLSENEAKDITTQILEGVKMIHAEGLTHRNLKTQAWIYIFISKCISGHEYLYDSLAESLGSP
jgi:serine/threonine protein kinase